jgi:hypothetical protein
MRAMTPGRRFKTREAQTLVTAAATRVVATQVAGATPAEVTRVVAILVAAILVAAILVVVIRAAVVTDLMGGAVIADGTRRVTKGWSS